MIMPIKAEARRRSTLKNNTLPILDNELLQFKIEPYDEHYILDNPLTLDELIANNILKAAPISITEVDSQMLCDLIRRNNDV